MSAHAQFLRVVTEREGVRGRWLESKQLQGMARASTVVVSGIADVLYRHLGGDPARIAEALDLPGGADWAALLLDSAALGIGSTRCDLVESGGVWHVLEVNATNAGGWITPTTLGLRETLGPGNLHGLALDTSGILLGQLCGEAITQGIAQPRDPLLLGIVVSGSSSEFSAEFLDQCNAALKRAAAVQPEIAAAKIEFVTWRDLAVNSSGVLWQDRRVHVLFEAEIVECSTRLLAAHAASQRRLLLVSGPFSQIANDKRLLALASELADGPNPGGFDRLRHFVPWTRCLRPEAVGCATVRELADFIRRDRHRLVLKKALSAGGQGVFIGHAIAEHAWHQVVDRALDERDWIVQEWVAPDIDDRLGAHVVWGAFVIGGEFAGGFARCLDPDGYGQGGAWVSSVQTISQSSNSDECVTTFPIRWVGDRDGSLRATGSQS